MNYAAKFWHKGLNRPHRLAYKVYGNGPRAVLLLHGIAADGRFWLPLTAQLDEREYQVVVPDLLGHGGSPTPEYILYSTDDQARAVLALIRRLHLSSVIIIGHSLGGLVATRIAVISPALVSKLLLYEPPLFADLAEFKTHARRQKFYLDIFDRLAKNPSGKLTVARVVAKLANNWSKYLSSERTWLPIERSLHNAVMQTDSFEELRDITIQTDIVHGRLDMVVPRTSLRHRLKANKNIRFYSTTDRHKLSTGSARYLARLIAPGNRMRDNSRKRKGGSREGSLE